MNDHICNEDVPFISDPSNYAKSPLFCQLNLLLLKHELLLDLGHVLICLDHLCIVVDRPQPRGTSLVKALYGFLGS